MCFSYDDSADIYESSQVKCRKPHKCRGCHRVIQRGETAEYVSGLFDHAWFRYYVCDRCQREVLAIALHEINEGCPWHTAWIAVEDLRDYQSEAAEYGERHEPLGMPTIADCRRVVDDAFERSRTKWWREEKYIPLEAY